MLDGHLVFHNCSLLKIKNGGDDWDRTNCDVSRKIYSLLPYHYGGISKFGWPTWARTRDILINSQTLYQLSYRPKTMVSVGRIELPSHGPKPRILPLNYTELKIGGGWEDRTPINSLQSCRNPIILIPHIETLLLSIPSWGSIKVLLLRTCVQFRMFQYGA